VSLGHTGPGAQHGAVGAQVSSDALGFSGCTGLLSPAPENKTSLDLGTLQLPSSPGPTRPACTGIKTQDAHEAPSLERPKGWEPLPQMKARLSSYRSLPNPTNQLHIN